MKVLVSAKPVLKTKTKDETKSNGEKKQACETCSTCDKCPSSGAIAALSEQIGVLFNM